MALERLQKILARGGVASRRATEDMIRAGRVRVNGRVVTELGTKADPRDDKVELDGKRVVAEDAVYVLCHKPRGVVSTMSDPEGRPTMATMLSSFDARLFPVGRLDFATSGALLATNDGAFADGLLHPKRAVPKTYVVKVNGIMEKEHLDRWRRGLELDDGPTQPAEVNFLRHEGDKTWFELTIKEGRNQQIRRMGEASGFLVMRLSRVAFAGITTEGLPPGGVRPLTRDELGALKKSYGVPKKMPTTFDLARAREEAEGPRRAVRSRPGPRPEHVAADVGTRRPRRPTDEARGGFREDAAGRGPGAASAARLGPGGASEARQERSGQPRAPERGGSRRAAPSSHEGAPTRGGEPAPRRGDRGRAPARSERPAPGRRGERSPGPERDRVERPARVNRDAQRRSDRPAPRDRGPAPERRSDRPAPRDRGDRPAPERRGDRPAPRDRGDRPAPERRGDRPAPRDRGPAPGRRGDHATSGARYGGGSPVRRGYDVTSDWGGGAGRGRAPETPNAPADHGGRGVSRTTGTGGGPKAPPGTYDRVKGRRGQR